MERVKIVIPDRIRFSKEHIKTLKALGDVTIYDDIPATEAEISRRIKDAEIITSNWVSIPRKTIDAATKLKFIAVPAVGYDWIDVEYAREKGIKVLNCPTFNTEAVVSHAIALLLATTRKLKPASRSIERGKWIRNIYVGLELKGSTMGIIGYGRQGRRVAEVASALGMKILHADSKTPKRELDAMIRASDVISLHMPLNKNTKHIINAKRINMMKRGAYIINVSRGALVDQGALIKALKSNKIAGAGLDVFVNEPFRQHGGKPSSQIIKLARLDNVVATPHIAFNTEGVTNRMCNELILGIKSCLKGKPINVVND